MNAHLQKLSEPISLEDLMVAMCHFGKPRVMRHDSGWCCSIDMHVASAGATFTVRSEFDRPTPLLAATQCASRIVETVSKYQTE